MGNAERHNPFSSPLGSSPSIEGGESRHGMSYEHALLLEQALQRDAMGRDISPREIPIESRLATYRTWIANLERQLEEGVADFQVETMQRDLEEARQQMIWWKRAAALEPSEETAAEAAAIDNATLHALSVRQMAQTVQQIQSGEESDAMDFLLKNKELAQDCAGALLDLKGCGFSDEIAHALRTPKSPEEVIPILEALVKAGRLKRTFPAGVDMDNNPWLAVRYESL